MRLKQYILLFSSLLVITGFSQVKYEWVNTIKTSATNFTTDNLGRVYLIENNEIIELNYKGDTLFTYSDKTHGNISLVDVSNTLRPLLFFKENGQLVVTDNTLSAQQASYNLEQLNLYQTQLVATSLVDNGIWIYDQELFQLIKVNTAFERIYESGNLEQILMKENLNPTQLIEHNAKVYLTSPSNGILIFDIYGSYIKTIPILNISGLQVEEDIIYYQKEGNYFAYSLLNFEEVEINLPVESYKKIRFEKDYLILLLEGKIVIYRVKKG